MKNTLKTKRGFTLIEIILVLAIAALIILIILLTAPAVSRNQRNNVTRQNMNRLVAAINLYRSNNKGQLPWHSPEYVAATSNYYDRCFGAISPAPAGAYTRHCVLDPYLEFEYGFIYAIKGAYYKDSDPRTLESGWNDVSSAEIKIYPGLRCKAFTKDGRFADSAKNKNNLTYAWPNDSHYAVIVHLEGSSNRDENQVYFCAEG